MDITQNSQSMNLTRQQFSETKARKRQQKFKPMVIDISDTQSEKAALPSVREQMDTLNAIAAYNKALKPARKVKDALPEIITTNVSTKERFVKDYKKQKINKERTYV